MSADNPYQTGGFPADAPLEALADGLVARAQAGQPFVLLLGRGLAAAAGVPPLAETARRIFAEIYQRDPDVARLYLEAELLQELQQMLPPESQADGPPADPQAWELALHGLLGGMSALARFSLLQRYLSRGVPVPRFYQDLARLLRDGYFNPVLNTNLDTLLEEALNGLGLQRGLDYQVFFPGALLETAEPPGEAPLRLFRLSSGLADPEPELKLQDLLAALQLPGGGIPTDLLLASYDFNRPEVNDALAAFPGMLWVVQPEPGEIPAFQALAQERRLQVIRGPTAEPERFFGFLNTLLKVQVQQELASAGGAEDWPDADQLESTYLRDQLRRTRNVLAGLEQERALKGAVADELSQQINYQQQQIELLTGQLLPPAEYGETVAQLLADIAAQAKKGGADHNSYLYLNYQARAVRRELEQGQTNQSVIATAVEATRTLVDRLPTGIIDLEQRQRLETLVAAPWEVE